jgi:TolB-like protein/Tfp pilus assembly protein PilF
MAGFFEEIKRRKVYRVAAAYVVVAGGVIQLASAVFPAWEMPAWALRLVIVLLLTGFPISLILAWALEVTPEGIRTTPTPPSTPRRRRNVIALLAVGVIVSAAAGFFILPRASARKLDKSIAVLPFENFSDDKENAYFADGIQDDLLTTLSKIGDLKVISRTSVMQYRGRTTNVREIGKALGVSAVLEGSVRRAGNRVRVNVQLIDATNDEHLWADEYDRELTDVFAIQSDLADKIATALRAKLSPAEKAQIERKPTENADAYLAFIQAHGYMTKPDRLPADLRTAEELYQRAVQLDPSFALAHANLSHLESTIYHFSDPTPARLEKARAAFKTASSLQPDLPETHVALGYIYYYGDRDYERALAEFEIAQRGLPNDSATYLAIAAIHRRQGKWADSTAGFEKAASLDPKDGFIWENLAINYLAMRNYPAVEKTLDRAMAVAPESMNLQAMRAELQIHWKGDIGTVEKALAKMPPGFDPGGTVTCARYGIYVLTHRYEEALHLMQQSPQQSFHMEIPVDQPKALFIGQALRLLHKDAEARAAYEEARGILEASVREVPDDAMRHALLGQIYAALGRKEDAIREGKRAMEILPESKDALEGPMATIGLAQIYAVVGDRDNALSLLEHLLEIPSSLSVHMLQLDPIWDSLRNDPRFIELLKKHGGSA